MRHCQAIIAAAVALCAGCYPTRIVTVSPDTPSSYTYSTTVTVPRTRVETTTTRIQAADHDISLYLDLQAIGAAFAQSSSVQEFENLINNSSYMLSNLDLNGDGYVDYLRVLETVDGWNHVFLIQAVVGANLYQDVATLVAETRYVEKPYVEIIGAPYIYGPQYIVRPVFVARPPIFTFLVRASYKPWRSPWYWDHFPSCYHHPAPIYVSHYQAYVKTYMTNHRYCHEVGYPEIPHYADYDRMTKSYQRNDYGSRHPEASFSVRNANTPVRTVNGTASSTRAINARDIRENQEAQTITRSTVARTTSATRSSSSDSQTRSASTPVHTSGTSGTSSRSATTGSSTSSRSASPQSSSKSSTVTTSGRSTEGATRNSSSQTTVSSKVRNSGTSTTKISTPSGTSTRTSSSAATRSAGTTRSAATGATRSSSSSSSASGSVGSGRSTSSSSTRSSSGSGSGVTSSRSSAGATRR